MNKKNKINDDDIIFINTVSLQYITLGSIRTVPEPALAPLPTSHHYHHHGVMCEDKILPLKYQIYVVCANNRV